MNIAVTLSEGVGKRPDDRGLDVTARLTCGAGAHVGAKWVVFYRVVKGP